MSRSELDFVIRAFISSCLHYSNSVFIFVNKAASERLQVVQNADVRLLINSSKYSHVTLISPAPH